MKQDSKLFFLFNIGLILICCPSCDYGDRKLKVWNYSPDSIAFIIPAEPNYFPTENESFGNSKAKHINDSLLNTYAKYDAHSDGQSMGGVHFVLKDSVERPLTFNTKWEYIINETPNKCLEIYFFRASVFTSGQFLWKDIWDKKMYLSKTKYTQEELEAADWNIYFRK